MPEKEDMYLHDKTASGYQTSEIRCFYGDLSHLTKRRASEIMP